MLLSLLLIIFLLGVILISTNILQDFFKLSIKQVKVIALSYNKKDPLANNNSNFINKIYQSKFLSLVKCKISSVYHFFYTLHWIFRFIIFTVFIIMFFSYKYLWKSLLFILPDTTTIVGQFNLFIVIYIVTILASLICLLIRYIDIININYKTIIISALFSIFFVLFLKFLFLDLTDFVIVMLIPIINSFIYERIEESFKLSVNNIEESFKLPVNNILFADRHSGIETGESSKSASDRAESSRGKSKLSDAYKEYRDLYVRSSNKKLGWDALTKFINKNNELFNELKTFENELKLKPTDRILIDLVNKARRDFLNHETKLNFAFKEALDRKQTNLDAIDKLESDLEIIKLKITEASEVGKPTKQLSNRKDSYLNTISRLKKYNESLDISLKTIKKDYPNLTTPSVPSRSATPSVSSTLDTSETRPFPIYTSINILPSLDNRPKLDLILSKNDATKRITDNNTIIDSIMPRFEDLSRKVNRDSSNSNLLERYNEVSKMIDVLQGESEKLSDKFNLSRSPTPEDN